MLHAGDIEDDIDKESDHLGNLMARLEYLALLEIQYDRVREVSVTEQHSRYARLAHIIISVVGQPVHNLKTLHNILKASVNVS